MTSTQLSSDSPLSMMGMTFRAPAGHLAESLASGLLAAGDLLIWPRPRRGQHHQATVLPDGWLRLDNGQEFASPSGAAKALTGYEINGWTQWRRAVDGVPLADLHPTADDEMATSRHRRPDLA